jgi:hypothetical protein
MPMKRKGLRMLETLRGRAANPAIPSGLLGHQNSRSRLNRQPEFWGIEARQEDSVWAYSYACKKVKDRNGDVVGCRLL